MSGMGWQQSSRHGVVLWLLVSGCIVELISWHRCFSARRVSQSVHASLRIAGYFGYGYNTNQASRTWRRLLGRSCTSSHGPP